MSRRTATAAVVTVGLVGLAAGFELGVGGHWKAIPTLVLFVAALAYVIVGLRKTLPPP